MAIHPTAVVDGSAEFGSDVEIGPHCFVGPNVTIGDGTILRNGATVMENAKIGRNNDIHSFAVIGGAPQDLKFGGEETWVQIGDDNVIREYVTINRGTGLGGGKTIVGNGCLIMAYAHVAHDCLIGDEVIISNAGTLAGHIHIGRKAIVSGLVAIHHFVSVGEYAFLGGCSKIVFDTPPYMMTVGSPAVPRGVNVVGLKRAGMSEESILALKDAFRALFHAKIGKTQALEDLNAKRDELTPEVVRLIEFMKATRAGKKGRALEGQRSS